jgi:type I restriction enzyme, S subunit
VTATVFIAPRRWLREEGSRLDASCFSSGGLEARDRIKEACDWRPLAALAQLFVGSRFARTYVTDRERGVPYLTGSEMLLADLVGLPLLSRARTRQLADLEVGRCWTLISCSGTIGRTVYVRGDMAGMALTHDVIRAVPNEERVEPGYLFAFLSSASGQAMIQQRTYGSVVQHIEPHHIADLPVPLPDEDMRGRIHALVEGAGTARTEAAELLGEVGAYFDTLVPPLLSSHDHARAVGIVRPGQLHARLDAFHHVGWAAESSGVRGDSLGDIAEVISTNRVPRIYTQRGVPFVSGIDVFRTRPMPRVRIAQWVADQFAAYVRTGDLAVQGSGQRYGLLGRVAHLGGRLDNWAASHDLFRIRAADAVTRARIFAYCRSESGHRSMLRHSYGTSIPHVNPGGIAALCIPDLPSDWAAKAVRALELREEADRDEEQAIQEFNHWLG